MIPMKEIDRLPFLWTEIARQWSEPQGEDRAWLLYAANYLFRTAGVRWALDPIRVSSRLPGAIDFNPAAFSNLDCLVLSHRHNDHLDVELLGSLSHLQMKWIAPDDLGDMLLASGIPSQSLVITHPGDRILIGDMTLTAFEGQHWERGSDYPDGRKGVPSLGFLVEFGGKRWLIPGDTRTYDANLLPDFGVVDGLIAHLWLGSGQAQNDTGKMMERFGRYCLDLRSRQVIITHLNEWGRATPDLWTEQHAKAALGWFRVAAPSLPVAYRLMGESFAL